MIRDHDYLETHDSWLFCVVGDIHPPDGYLAFLKYVPGEGPWRRGGRSFRRVVETYSTREFAETLRMLKQVKPRYVRIDPHINAEMSIVPRDEVRRYYRCGEAVERVLSKADRDKLEDKARSLILEVMDIAGVDAGDLGLTGSLLLGIHHGSSDIDLIVYGGREFWRVWRALNEAGYMGVEGGETLERILSRYPITRGDASRLVERMRNKGVYRGVRFSIHGVRKPHEVGERYCERSYKAVGVGKGVLRIHNHLESCFTPAIYGVDGDVSCDGRLYHVEKLVCYDLTFATLFRRGDRVEALGKLEEVRERSGKRYHILLVGSTLTAGREYVRIV